MDDEVREGAFNQPDSFADRGARSSPYRVRRLSQTSLRSIDMSVRMRANSGMRAVVSRAASIACLRLVPGQQNDVLD
jgi:hypothetical protein